MRIAWLLGVFLFQPRPGLAAVRGAKDLSTLLNAGELPPIMLAPLPDRPSPDPEQVRDAVPAYEPRLPAHARPILLRGPRLGKPDRPAPQPQAPAAVMSPVAEVEALGEDLRDSVAPAPSLERFLAALHDPDSSGRCQAIETFSYPGNFAAIPYVSAVLLRLDEALPVRVAAARALGRVGDRRAWSFLTRAVRDREPQVRLACAVALGRIARSSAPRLPARAASLP